MEISTEEMLWAGLHAGPVHVLQNTSEGMERDEAERERGRDGKRLSQKAQRARTRGPSSITLSDSRFLFHY